jgi:phosphotransferase system enzyme I (PtsI)
MAELTGVAASPGVGLGRAHLVRSALALPVEPTSTDVPADAERLGAAIRDVAAAYDERAARASGEAAEILSAVGMMARDPDLEEAAIGRMWDGQGPVGAILDASDAAATALEQSDSPYLAARGSDVRAVGRQVAQELLGIHSGLDEVPPASVVVADELAVSDLLELGRGGVIVALVTTGGAISSHLGIVARMLGIPAVFAVADALEQIPEGTQLLVDGEAGAIHPEPSTETIERVRSAAASLVDLEALEDLRTTDGIRIELAANIAGRAELDRALERGAEAVGLLRTELLYLARETAPSEDEQAEIYADLADRLEGRRLVIRTFDFGADKPCPFLDQPTTPNPALGIRGIRLAHLQVGLLDTQLRAIARATGPGRRLAVMAPMIATVEEAHWFRERVAAADPTGALEVGAMIEVPSAVFLAGDLAASLDFLSVGSNDLSQYLHAADREVDRLAGLLDVFSPSLLRAMRYLGREAEGHGAWVGVCGEAAADPLWALAAIGAGARELSMSPGALGRVRTAVEGTDLARCKAVLEAACAATDAASARLAAGRAATG